MYWQFSHSSKVLSLSFLQPQVDDVLFFPVKLCFKVFFWGAEGFTKWYVSHVHVETSKYEASHPTWLQHRSISRRTHSSANSFRRRKSTEQQESCISKQKKMSNQRCFLLSDLFQGRTKRLEWCILHISILHGKFLGVAESPKILDRYMSFHIFSLCFEGSTIPMEVERCMMKARDSHIFDTSLWHPSHLWKMNPGTFVWKHPNLKLEGICYWITSKMLEKVRRIPGLLRFVGQFRFCLCDLLLIEVWKPRLREISPRASWNLSSCNPGFSEKAILKQWDVLDEISIFNCRKVYFSFWSNEIVDNENAYVILQCHLELDEDIDSPDDLPEIRLRYLDIIYIYILYIYMFTVYIHPLIMVVYPHWNGKTVLCIPLRIQGWPGIAGFAVGVAIVMKAPNSSRGSWVAWQKKHHLFAVFRVNKPWSMWRFGGKKTIVGRFCLKV